MLICATALAAGSDTATRVTSSARSDGAQARIDGITKMVSDTFLLGTWLPPEAARLVEGLAGRVAPVESVRGPEEIEHADAMISLVASGVARDLDDVAGTQG